MWVHNLYSTSIQVPKIFFCFHTWKGLCNVCGLLLCYLGTRLDTTSTWVMQAIGTEKRKYTLPLARFSSGILPRQNRSSEKQLPTWKATAHTSKGWGNWRSKERSNLHNCWISLIALLLNLALSRADHLTTGIFISPSSSNTHTYMYTRSAPHSPHETKSATVDQYQSFTQHTNFIKLATKCNHYWSLPNHLASPPQKRTAATAICTLIISNTLRQ